MMLRVEVVLVLCGLCAIGTALIGRTQSAGARGVLTCNGRPLRNVLVKLYDEDDGGIDDLMAKTKTDANGHFELSGSEDEFTPIDPKINIYHDCNDGVKPCQRKVTIKIPDRYITPGKYAKNFYEAGTLELAGKFPGESRDCLH
uniref:Transthyretin-like family protein n=1 Tax=Panagrellus redivivus TaxID=6233 RepID=A0A7E4WDF0_PANRE